MYFDPRLFFRPSRGVGVSGLAQVVGPFFTDLPELTLITNVDLAEAIVPLVSDGAMIEYPFHQYIGPAIRQQLFVTDTARLQLAEAKGLEISDLRKDLQTGLITWEGMEPPVIKWLDSIDPNRCVPPDMWRLRILATYWM